VRTFIAIELPPDVKTVIADFQNKLKKHRPDVSWIKPENMHLTLKFLGEVEENKINEIHSSLQRVCAHFDEFEARVKDSGGFPNLKNPRVLWVGLEDNFEKFKKLQKEIETVCGRLGFGKEEKNYLPHITIGRVKSPKFMYWVARELEDTNLEAVTFPVNEVVGMRSILKSTGAVYNKLFTVKF
jgi:2'-5' RNA ligase